MAEAVTDPELLRIDRVAGLLDCGKSKVYDLVRRGEIESVRLGADIRVPREALAAFIARLREQA